MLPCLSIPAYELGELSDYPQPPRTWGRLHLSIEQAFTHSVPHNPHACGADLARLSHPRPANLQSPRVRMCGANTQTRLQEFHPTPQPPRKPSTFNPRVRGRRESENQDHRASPSTPACAGPTSARVLTVATEHFNPRVCGADMDQSAAVVASYLQPPRVRGRLGSHLGLAQTSASTPTHVGQTL